MTASGLFQIFNLLALAGWAILGSVACAEAAWLRDTLAGTCIPVALSAAYAILIAFFFFGAEGGLIRWRMSRSSSPRPGSPLRAGFTTWPLISSWAHA